MDVFYPKNFNTNKIFGSYSEQFQLLGWCIRFHRLGSMKNLHHPKLPICDLHDSDFAFGRKISPDALAMNIGIFATGTKSHVDRELEHRKPIFHQFLPKTSGYLSILSRLGRKVKKN